MFRNTHTSFRDIVENEWEERRRAKGYLQEMLFSRLDRFPYKFLNQRFLDGFKNGKQIDSGRLLMVSMIAACFENDRERALDIIQCCRSYSGDYEEAYDFIEKYLLGMVHDVSYAPVINPIAAFLPIVEDPEESQYHADDEDSPVFNTILNELLKNVDLKDHK